MKRYFIFSLYLFLLFAFTACGSENLETSCYNCNEVISIEDTYCKYCGAKVVDNVDKNYKSHASVLISDGTVNDTSISNSDIKESKSYAITCIEIFKSLDTMQKVQKQLDFYISLSDLEKSIQFNFQSEDSIILNITVLTDKKTNSDKILSCLLSEYPSIVENLFPNARFSILSISE